MTSLEQNQLYYGDNLDVLRSGAIEKGSVDLVYLDPPFQSARNYNVLFKDPGGEKDASQIKAFEDTWTWDTNAVALYQETVTAGGKVSTTLEALYKIVGPSPLMSYLAQMAPRLVELHKVLKKDGVIWLHVDPTASHYLKLLMDAIFEAQNFRNEIIWCYRGGGVSKSWFARKHDVLFFYAMAKGHYFKPQYVPYSESTQQVTGRTGKRVNKTDIDLERGAHMPDWWTDINSLQTWSPERIGYQTQKPQALLERIIDSTCPKGGLVLDPFAGCGTTIAAAQALSRRWIGIDITSLAIEIVEKRLAGMGASSYKLIGKPTSVQDARKLAEQDHKEFELWANALLGSVPWQEKKGSDGGIDGMVTWFENLDPTPRRMIVSVKGGKSVGVAMIRELTQVVTREQAHMGCLVSIAPPTKPMRAEAAGAGAYKDDDGNEYQRIQLITVAELLDGQRLVAPLAALQSMQFGAKEAKQAKPVDQMTLGHISDANDA